MAFEIIKNYHMPDLPGGPGRYAIYPFSSMEVGDGFEVPDDKGFGKNGVSKALSRVATAAGGYAKRHNPEAKFVTRRIKDRGVVGCVRVK